MKSRQATTPTINCRELRHFIVYLIHAPRAGKPNAEGTSGDEPRAEPNREE